MIRDCDRFDAWLDGGSDPALAAAARAHAAGCARCAAALELESLLAAPPAVDAGAAFTEGVMFRVRDAGRARAARELQLADGAEAWWLRAPAEPSVALALAVAALLVWRGDGLWAAAERLGAWANAHDWTRGPGSAALDLLAPALSHLPTATLPSSVLVAVLLPVVGAASYALYRLVETAVANATTSRGVRAMVGASPAR